MEEIGNIDKWWWPLWEFVLHVVVGTLTFVLVAVPAVLLNHLVAYLEKLPVDQIIIKGLTALEYLIFAVDLAFVAIFWSDQPTTW